MAILIPFCLVNIGQGLRELDPELMELARAYTRDARRTLLLVTVPLRLVLDRLARRFAG